MKMLTVKEGAKQIGRSVSFISKKCEDGAIPFKISKSGRIRTRLISEADLIRFQDEYEEKLASSDHQCVAPARERDMRPRCQHCEIILEMAPEGYSGKYCNYCWETAVSEEV